MTPTQLAPKDWSQQTLEQCLAQERSFLFRLARSQLRDEQAADDVVQETLMAAWQSFDRFEGRSSVRTWLVSILRFKILDDLRHRQRQPVALAVLDLDHEMESLVADDLLFNGQGQWAEMPKAWGHDGEGLESPDELLQQKQMLKLLETCLSQLPEKTAHVFLMREYLGFEGEEIAQRTGLKAAHVRVVLSRVRLSLRTCMDHRMNQS